MPVNDARHQQGWVLVPSKGQHRRTQGTAAAPGSAAPFVAFGAS
jgi:hypothetical protein